MQKTNDKETDNKDENHTAGMIVKGAGAVAAGAAVVAAGVALSDKKRRDAFGKKAGQAITFISDTIAEANREVPEKVAEVKDQVKKAKKSGTTSRANSKGRQSTAQA